ncbi:MAG: hypothetical protein QY311_01830 [Candidatus Paceibacterota bacterium]|nr:MAG: hypothetical protein QY311_01830 [Candidatus Paceibacterota bacterium]
MPRELPKQYDHTGTESDIYALWEKSGFFNLTTPPNATKNHSPLFFPHQT